MTLAAVVGIAVGVVTLLGALVTAVIGIWRAGSTYTRLSIATEILTGKVDLVSSKVEQVTGELHARVSGTRDHLDARIDALEDRSSEHSKQIALLQHGERRKKA